MLEVYIYYKPCSLRKFTNFRKVKVLKYPEINITNMDVQMFKNEK